MKPFIHRMTSSLKAFLYIMSFVYIMIIIAYIIFGPIHIFHPIPLSIADINKPAGILALLLAFIYAIHIVRRETVHRYTDGFEVMLLIFLLCVAVQGLFTPLMLGDGGSYYAWLRSIVIDMDLDFTNDYQVIYKNANWDILYSTNGRPLNKYPIGVAIFEIPGFLIGHVISYLFGHPLTGVSNIYIYFVSFFNLSFFFCGAYLFLRIIGRLTSGTIALAMVTTLILGTNVIHYLVRDVGYSHAPAVTLSFMLIYLINADRKKNQASYPFHAIIIGLLLGIFLVLRYSNVFLLPFFIFMLSVAKRQFKWRYILSGIALPVALQLLAANFVFEKPTIYTYGDEGFILEPLNLLKVLFSNHHGLFFHHPWYAVLLMFNLYGVYLLKSDKRVICFLSIVAFTSLWLTNGFWWYWWFGSSFGNRAFIEILPLLTFGAALVVKEMEYLFQYRHTIITAILVGIIALNLYTWVGFLTNNYDHCGNHSPLELYAWPINTGEITHCRGGGF